MKKLLSLLGLLRDKKEAAIPNKDNVIQGLEPVVTADPEAMEVFINSDKDRFAELYYEHGGYTYTMMEKHSDDSDGTAGSYWCPGTYTASYFDTREKAVRDILSRMEGK